MKKDYRFRDKNLSARERADDLVSLLTIEEKVKMVTTEPFEVPRFGITKKPYPVEIARGLVQRDQRYETTLLPQPWGMAAMFDSDLMEKLGDMAGDEVRIGSQREERPNGLMLLGPTVDMERDPRWGRNEEAYGEDPFLAGEMSGAYCRGLRGNDPYYIKTAPLLKHFYANNSENDRLTTNAYITPRLKRDYYLQPFERGVRKGAVGLMTAYNCINGIEGINNPDVTDICKKEWGMILAVSDGGDFGQNVAAHRTYETHAEAIADILGVGADVMLDSAEMVEPAIRDALRQGLLSEWQLDIAVRDMLEVRIMLGELDEDNPYANMDQSKRISSEHKLLAVEASRKSMILLENKGMLPLKDDGECKIAITGPLSNENYTCWYCGYAANQTPVVKGFIEKLGKDRVLFDEGFDHVIIKSQKTGKYLKTGNEEQLFADAQADDAEVFEINDWDYGSWTLRSLKTGKYVTENRGFGEMMAAMFKGEKRETIDFDFPIRCCADEAFGWHVMEHIKIEKDEDGNVYMKTWQDRSVTVDCDSKINSISGLPYDGSEKFAIEVISCGKERAAKLAAKADYAIVCGGNHPLINARECYDRPDLNLPKSQSALLDAVSAANPNTLLYLVSSYPFSIVKEKDVAKAVLASSHLGPCLGHVAADTVFGDNVPAGRTPVTWYRSVYDLPDLEDYDISKNNMTYLYFKGEPLYPFGYGLSYSNFEYSSAKLDKTRYETGENIKATIDVTNTGDHDADEVVQVYVKPAKSFYKRPVKMLKAFKRVSIIKGETVTVELTVPYDELAFWSTENDMFEIDAGDYTFEIGASSSDIRASITAFVDGVTVKPRDGEMRIDAIDTEDYGGVQFLTDKSDGQSYIEGKEMLSYAVYPAFDLKGLNTCEMILSSPAGQIDMTIVDHKTGEIIGNYSGDGTGSFTAFVPVEIAIKPRDEITDIRLVFVKQISIKSFRFFYDERF